MWSKYLVLWKVFTFFPWNSWDKNDLCSRTAFGRYWKNVTCPLKDTVFAFAFFTVTFALANSAREPTPQSAPPSGPTPATQHFPGRDALGLEPCSVLCRPHGSACSPLACGSPHLIHSVSQSWNLGVASLFLQPLFSQEGPRLLNILIF